MKEEYTLTAKVLHWVSAAIIVWATVSGFYASTLPNDSVLKHAIGFFNVSITTLFIPIFAFRVIYKIKSGTPSAHHSISKKNQTIAAIAHTTLYAMTSVVLLSGVLMMNNEINVFGVVCLPCIIESIPLQHFFEETHSISTMLLATVIAMHLMAVIKHELEGKRVLKRML